MILVYTGNGKGKTSACVGQAVRALGQDLRVAFVQFMKQDVEAGEQRLLRELLGPHLHIGGCGFFRNEADRPRHREAARTTLHWARNALPEVDMLIADESLYALRAGLLTREELIGGGDEPGLIPAARQHGTHLVLSGRDMPEWLGEAADLVTVMNEVKHPWRSGIPACKGIEY